MKMTEESIILYHFTSDLHISGCLCEGLTKGVTIIGRTCTGIKMIDNTQWLTGNPNFEQSWQLHSTLPYDRTANRLTIHIPKLSMKNLISWCQDGRILTPEFYDILSTHGDPENWFIYLGGIPPEWIIEVIKKIIKENEMSRKNSPNHGSLNQVRGRYYYKAKLPGTHERKTYPLTSAGQTKSTTDRRTAIALANEMWERAKTAAALEGDDADYDGTLPTLKELFLKVHEKEIADKDEEVRKKEMRFYRTALNDLIAFFKTVPFSLLTFELRPNRILLWRKFLNAEKSICRSTINKKVNVVKQMIQYAVNREIEPAHLAYEVGVIKPVKKGQENFKDYDEVGPAEWTTVEKLFPYLDSMIQDMLLLSRYTGARPGEIRLMRPCDIDQTDTNAWVFSLDKHKTRRHGIVRKIVIGLDAQPILLKYMVRPGQAYCFPARLNHHGDTGQYYTSGSFAKVITRAVAAYNAENPKTPIQFHANQLRHTFATSVCLEHGLEVTRCALGHATTQMTKRYARQALAAEQLKNAKQAVQKIG